MNKKSLTQGFSLAALGVILFSSKAVMVKLAYQYEVDSISLLLLRMLFSLPFYLAVAFWNREEVKKNNTTKKDYLSLVILGFIGYYLASYFDFKGLELIDASLERLILFLYPTFVVVLGFLLLKKKINSSEKTAIGLSYLGLTIMFSPQILGGIDEKFSWLGVSLIILSALTYASYLLGSGELIPKFGSKLFTSYAMLVSCVCVIIHFGISMPSDIFSFHPMVYLYGFLMAVFATVIPSFLISESIKKIGASKMSIVGSIGPVSTITLSYIFLDERLTLIQILGALIIISAVMWMNFKKQKK